MAKLATQRNCRNHPNYWAFAVHRISGVVLVLYLPVHFYVMGLAIESEAALQGFFSLAENPLVKLAESVLIITFVIHVAGGLRLLMIEFLAWRDWQKTVITLSGGIGLTVGLVFLFNVF